MFSFKKLLYFLLLFFLNFKFTHSSPYSSFDHEINPLLIPYAFNAKNQTLKCLLGLDEDPLPIHSEFEFIYVYDYGILNITSKVCIWKFSSPKNYGFKVVITEFYFSKESKIFVRNSTDLLVNKRSLKVEYPYYNEDDYIEIQLNNSTAFYAVITIVNKTAISYDKCYTTKNSTTTTWYIDTWKRLSFLNVKCFYEFIIPVFTEITVIVKNFLIEKNVDYIRYTDDNNNSVTVVVDLLKDTVFKLFNYNNGSNQRYLFEYANDGSVASLGNYITFSKITCKCIAPTIPCSLDRDGTSGIMNTGQDYCGNLRCSFIIEPCSNHSTKILSEITLLQLSFTGSYSDSFQDESDSFKVYSNEKMVMEIEINYFNIIATNYIIYLNSSNLNKLEVFTYPSKVIKGLYLLTAPRNFPPIYSTLTLSKCNLFTVIDTGLFPSEIITVLASKDIMNPSFLIFSSFKYGLSIYNNATLSVNYYSRSCFGDLNPYSCKIDDSEIAILSPPTNIKSDYPIFTVQLQNYRQKGCVFQKYIYLAEENNYDFPVVIVAATEDICLATILIPNNENYHYFMSNLWTTSVKENVKVYAGTESFLFEFNSHTAKKWTSIGLYSHIYTIKVPKSATVYMRIQKLKIEVGDIPTITVLQNNFYSIMSTALYGTSKITNSLQSAIKYCAIGHVLKFTLIYSHLDVMDISLNDTSYIVIKNVGDTFAIENQCTTLVYNSENVTDINDGAVFYIETEK